MDLSLIVNVLLIAGLVVFFVAGLVALWVSVRMVRDAAQVERATARELELMARLEASRDPAKRETEAHMCPKTGQVACEQECCPAPTSWKARDSDVLYRVEK